MTLSVWQHARKAIVVSAGGDLAARAGRVVELAAVLQPGVRGFSAWVSALRPYQLSAIAGRWGAGGYIGVPVLAMYISRTERRIALLGLGGCGAGC